MDCAGKGLLMVCLTGCMVWDIRTREFPLWWLLVFLGLGFAQGLIFGERSSGEMLWGMAPGLALLIMGWLSRGAIGSGDGWMVLVSGIYLTWSGAAAAFLWGLLLMVPVCLILFARKKISGKSKLPFAPFFWAGCLCRLTLG